MKLFSNSNKIKALVAPKMTYLITFLKNSGKLATYTGVNIHGLYICLETIGSPTTLTTSGQRSHHFGSSSSTNNDTSTIHSLLKLYVLYRTLFANAVDEVDKSLMTASSADLTYPHQVLEEISTN